MPAMTLTLTLTLAVVAGRRVQDGACSRRARVAHHKLWRPQEVHTRRSRDRHHCAAGLTPGAVGQGSECGGGGGARGSAGVEWLTRLRSCGTQVLLVDQAALRSHSLVGDVYLEFASHQAALHAMRVLSGVRLHPTLPTIALAAPRPRRKRGKKWRAGDKEAVVEVHWASLEEWLANRAVFVPRFF